MKKKTFALCGLVAVAGISLASCTDNGGNGGNTGGTTTIVNDVYTEAPADVVYDTTGGELDVYINYSGTSGITYRGSTPYSNPVDRINYTQGGLLPTWKAFAEKTKTTIYDAADYGTTKDDDTYKAVLANKFMSATTTSRNIDLFYNTVKNINAMGGAGNAVNLLEHLDKMPNFKKFIDANPTIYKGMLREDGKALYYTPYFDGYNDIERMFVMDTAIASKVLDAPNFDVFDATTTNGGATPSANVIQTAAYTPYMNATYNYADETTNVEVLVGTTTKQTISIKRTNNIIVQQNALISKGCTGKELAEQLRTYLTAAFGEYIGEGKIYENYSDIFVSESAAYNADELIALMRVVKANPGIVTGNPAAEVETLFPRGQGNNRVDNMADLMQIWGVQGMTSEKEMLYFTADGKLNDAATTKQTYDALQNVSAMYDEGLILNDFWYKGGNTSGTAYLDKYFKKTTDNPGYGFMMYDYSAATTAANDMVTGVGTKDDDRKIEGYHSTGIMPILPPLAYWASETGWNVNNDLTNFANKTLMRYAEENRSIKSTTWCIPSNCDNLDGALRLMDYMFTEKGAMIQDFGPEAYWQTPSIADGDSIADANGNIIENATVDSTKAYVSTTLVPGELTPVMSTSVKGMIMASGKDFWSFMREHLGSTHGVGCERSKGLDIQATNAYGQIGLMNVKNAIAAGIVDLALVDKVLNKTTWDTTVPTEGYESIAKTVSDTYLQLTDFWSSDKCADVADGWVSVVAAAKGSVSNETNVGNDGSKDYTYGQVLAQFTIKNKSYLYILANSLGNEFIPDYARQ